MKTSSKTYTKLVTLSFVIAIEIFMIPGAMSYSAAPPGPKFPSTVELPVIVEQFEHKRHTPAPDHSERYLPYTLNHGLRMALPAPMRNNFDFDAGYDKWRGLPTFKMDCFIPVKAWPDKSVFFTPRALLTGNKESYAIGAGIRQLVTSDVMVGFHSFYDWTRPRRLADEFLREAGVGIEFSALPGRYSDLTLSANAYFPVNSREEIAKNGVSIFQESLPSGADARISFQLPPIVSWLDFRFDASAHRYAGQASDRSGYQAALSVNSRDGMFNLRLEQGNDSRWGRHYNVTAGLRVDFDWNSIIEAKNPFSAPYKYSETRYNRKVRNSLFSRVNRKYDLPEDRYERRSTLMASVMGETVTFTGGFPNLPYSSLTVQISQSPWRDLSEVLTDDKGVYYGAISLPPGVCRIRLLHKPSGRVTEPKTVVISDPESSPESERSSGANDL
jgi:hypothetical protein